jgi:VWFA-related protein
VALLAVALPAVGQTSSASHSGDRAKQQSPQGTSSTLKVRVNVVEVRAVVRDDQGKPVANLRKDDFRVYDDGKLQPIMNFAVEGEEARKAAEPEKAGRPVEETSLGVVTITGPPERFVALLFDDTHLEDTDLSIARNAAREFLDGVGRGDRIGFYSMSGQFTHEFTGDKEQLKRSLPALVPHPQLTSMAHDCPRLSYYLANQVDTFHDTTAFQIIVNETLDCAFAGDKRMTQEAQSMAKTAIRQAISFGEADNNFAYDHIGNVLRRLAEMPGKRTLLVVSPGFSLTARKERLLHLVDQANRAQIVINTLDARGLYTAADYAGSTSGVPSAEVINYHADEQKDQSVLLAALAEGTGGTHFRNSNDISGGLKQLGEAPPITYVLVISPQAQKANGAFHKLKVELTGNAHYQIQARNGYYAEKKNDNPEEQAKAEIQEALYSPSEVQDMPMEWKTQSVKSGTDEARIAVITRLGIKEMRFRKVDDRNCNTLTVVTAIFDDNGNYVMGEQTHLELNLDVANYQRLLSSGVLMKGEYKVKPGRYVVRQLVRESEDGQMSVRSGFVDIPK